jgi:galactitol-specific phosphotransferase system IIB component
VTASDINFCYEKLKNRYRIVNLAFSGAARIDIEEIWTEATGAFSLTCTYNRFKIDIVREVIIDPTAETSANIDTVQTTATQKYNEVIILLDGTSVEIQTYIDDAKVAADGYINEVITNVASTSDFLEARETAAVTENEAKTTAADIIITTDALHDQLDTFLQRYTDATLVFIEDHKAALACLADYLAQAKATVETRTADLLVAFLSQTDATSQRIYEESEAALKDAVNDAIIEREQLLALHDTTAVTVASDQATYDNYIKFITDNIDAVKAGTELTISEVRASWEAKTVTYISQIVTGGIQAFRDNVNDVDVTILDLSGSGDTITVNIVVNDDGSAGVDSQDITNIHLECIKAALVACAQHSAVVVVEVSPAKRSAPQYQATVGEATPVNPTEPTTITPTEVPSPANTLMFSFAVLLACIFASF